MPGDGTNSTGEGYERHGNVDGMMQELRERNDENRVEYVVGYGPEPDPNDVDNVFGENPEAIYQDDPDEPGVHPSIGYGGERESVTLGMARELWAELREVRDAHEMALLETQQAASKRTKKRKNSQRKRRRTLTLAEQEAADIARGHDGEFLVPSRMDRVLQDAALRITHGVGAGGRHRQSTNIARTDPRVIGTLTRDMENVDPRMFGVLQENRDSVTRLERRIMNDAARNIGAVDDHRPPLLGVLRPFSTRGRAGLRDVRSVNSRNHLLGTQHNTNLSPQIPSRLALETIGGTPLPPNVQWRDERPYEEPMTTTERRLRAIERAEAFADLDGSSDIINNPQVLMNVQTGQWEQDLGAGPLELVGEVDMTEDELRDLSDSMSPEDQAGLITWIESGGSVRFSDLLDAFPLLLQPVVQAVDNIEAAGQNVNDIVAMMEDDPFMDDLMDDFHNHGEGQPVYARRRPYARKRYGSGSYIGGRGVYAPRKVPTKRNMTRLKKLKKFGLKSKLGSTRTPYKSTGRRAQYAKLTKGNVYPDVKRFQIATGRKMKGPLDYFANDMGVLPELVANIAKYLYPKKEKKRRGNRR